MAAKETTTARTATRTPSFRKPNHRAASATGAESFFFFSAKVSVYLLTSCVCLIILFQVRNLQTAFSPLGTPGLSSSWSLPGQWQKFMNMTTTAACLTDSVDEEARKDQPEQNLELQGMLEKLRQSVTFLPLKDLRYADKHMEGNTWFMSTMNDTHEKGEVLYGTNFSPQIHPSIECYALKGTTHAMGHGIAMHSHGADALPPNSTYLPGLTFVSYNPYIYDNIWHGLSAIHPFVAWHQMNQCHPGPDRWVLYYLGELRFNMASWLRNITDATFDRPTNIETFDGVAVASQPVCFEKAVVIRHGQSGMSRERMMEAYDLMRCKARKYCKLDLNRVLKGDVPDIGLTMFMRTGARSFKNESAVIAIFQRECDKVDGCRLTVAHSDNLSFCEQVKVMSMTDILVSSHGAQLTNMFLMDRNSSVMEFFPKGWLETAGVGQYVYHWMASWSGMSHAGAWRDPDGESCPYPKSDLRCMSFYKDGRIGHNETYFAEWARKVLSEVKTRKMEELRRNSATPSASSDCACRSS